MINSHNIVRKGEYIIPKSVYDELVRLATEPVEDDEQDS